MKCPYCGNNEFMDFEDIYVCKCCNWMKDKK